MEAELLGDWTLVVELNGFRATDIALLRRLSKGGEAVVVYDNVNALMLFRYARDGRILRDFDPLLDPSDEATDRLLEEQGITFPGDNDELHPLPGVYLFDREAHWHPAPRSKPHRRQRSFRRRHQAVALGRSALGCTSGPPF